MVYELIGVVRKFWFMRVIFLEKKVVWLVGFNRLLYGKCVKSYIFYF